MVDRHGQRKQVAYDKLVIGTGAEPAKPPIHGLESDGVLMLHTIEDSLRVHDQVVSRDAQRAVVIGGG